MADPVKVGKGILNILKGEKEAAKVEGKIADVLASQSPPMTTPMGTGLPLLPRSAGMYTPGVPQVDLPRMPMVDKARAAGQKPKYTERMQDLLDSPTARKKVDELIRKGEPLGVKEWYGTEPLRQAAMDIGLTPEKYHEFMAQLASASQRNPVDKQNQMGSYLWHLSQTGQLPEDAFLLTNAMKSGKKEMPKGTPVEFPSGYGSLAQSAIFERGKQIAHEGVDAALPPNAKLGTFYRNLTGNLQPVTVDVNAVRGPVIARGDPRWLASKLVEKDEAGNIINSYAPRKMLESGEMTLKEAKARPGFWEAAPAGSEYAGMEELWQRAAKRHNMAPAEAQALGWYGSGDITALKSKPELYVENIERLIKRTAEQTGKQPTEVLNDMLTGKGFLRKEGGFIERVKSGLENYAVGGGVTNTSDTRPDTNDGGNMIPAPFYAKGGGIKLKHKSLRDIKRFDKGGSTDQSHASKVWDEVTKNLKAEYEREKGVLSTPEGRRDVLGRTAAQFVGGANDLRNLLAKGVDIVQEQIPFLREPASVLDPTGEKLGYKPKVALSSDEPWGGSGMITQRMQDAGLIGDQSAPLVELVAGIGAPMAAPRAVRAAEKGLNAATAAARRPFTPATATVEAVAPDLAKFKPSEWQQTVTNRLTGPGGPVDTTQLGGLNAVRRQGQGVFYNREGQLELNPMVALDVKSAGNLSKNQPFRRDLAQIGQDLAQEGVAAHRFLPMLTNNINDATAMLIKTKGGNLTNEQVMQLGRDLPGMVVTHNPRLGGVVVYPFELPKTGIPEELTKATDVAKDLFGKQAKVTYGRVHPSKDTVYISDYAKEGATAPSAGATKMRERLKKAETRLFPEPAKATAESP